MFITAATRDLASDLSDCDVFFCSFLLLPLYPESMTANSSGRASPTCRPDCTTPAQCGLSACPRASHELSPPSHSRASSGVSLAELEVDSSWSDASATKPHDVTPVTTVLRTGTAGTLDSRVIRHKDNGFPCISGQRARKILGQLKDPLTSDMARQDHCMYECFPCGSNSKELPAESQLPYWSNACHATSVDPLNGTMKPQQRRPA